MHCEILRYIGMRSAFTLEVHLDLIKLNAGSAGGH